MVWQLLLVSLLLAGCSLPSISLPTGGNAGTEDIGAGIHRISLPRGKANCATLDECTLLAAAAEARRAGATHFVVVPGHGSQSQRGFAYIKVFTLRDGEVAPTGAVSADEILYFLEKRPGAYASNSWSSVTTTRTPPAAE
jgi:hypothetical protein